MAGRFEADGDSVCFVPAFPFRDGSGYSLFAADGPIASIQKTGRVAASATEVVEIYPTAAEVPVNLLKLYVQFSAPMSEGWALRLIRVQRAEDGEPLEDVFLKAEPELWDRDRTRLTMLLDPGRIKRGLVPNEEAGYPLVEGEAIVVSIDATFRDAAGQPLRAAAERRYAVGAAERRRVHAGGWRLLPPRVDSREPLTVEFDRPLDAGLLRHSLSVVDEVRTAIRGMGTIAEGERAWRFEPESNWSRSSYRLSVDARLEDLAGNSVARVFDRDMTLAEDDPAGPTATIEFRPTKA